ncbi:hypothetical protein [Xanthomonas massiliensis]|jgi:hypothetical protein|uniref:hypothetical protein n=1 Tax=Xanthomonas massiliensis TaxID=1720302 RepID=UPI0008251F22|nr:hypothetical protein [Xanthomonas massiliensis]
MSIVLYVGGSRDGEKGVMPYGFTKSMTEGEAGREIYVERRLQVHGGPRLRVMALETLDEDGVREHLRRHRQRPA